MVLIIVRQELNQVLSQLDTNHIYPVMLWIKVSSLSRITCQIVFFFAKAEVKHADRYSVEDRGAVSQRSKMLLAS